MIAAVQDMTGGHRHESHIPVRGLSPVSLYENLYLKEVARK